MSGFNKKSLSERDVCTKLITPAILKAGWTQDQFMEEVPLTAGRVMVRGQVAKRVTNPKAPGGPKRADYVLYAKRNVPLAIIEAKKRDLYYTEGVGQAKDYAERLNIKYTYSTNGLEIYQINMDIPLQNHNVRKTRLIAK